MSTKAVVELTNTETTLLMLYFRLFALFLVDKKSVEMRWYDICKHEHSSVLSAT